MACGQPLASATAVHPGDFLLGLLLRPVGLDVDRLDHVAAGDVLEVFVDRVVPADRLIGAEDARHHRPGQPGQVVLPPDVVMGVDDGPGHGASPQIERAWEGLPSRREGVERRRDPGRERDEHALGPYQMTTFSSAMKWKRLGMGGGVGAGGLAGLGAEGGEPRRVVVEPHLADRVIGRSGFSVERHVHPVAAQARQLLGERRVLVERPVAELVVAHAFLALHQRQHFQHRFVVLSLGGFDGGAVLARMPRRTFSGVMGSESTRTPTASKIALAMAGIGELAVISPTPLAP